MSNFLELSPYNSEIPGIAGFDHQGARLHPQIRYYTCSERLIELLKAIFNFCIGSLENAREHWNKFRLEQSPEINIIMTGNMMHRWTVINRVHEYIKEISDGTKIWVQLPFN